MAYFSPSHFCREDFYQSRKVFFQKHYFFIIFSSFLYVQGFLTFRNLRVWGKRHFQEGILFDTRFYSNFCTFGDFDKTDFFSKNPSTLPKKTENSNVFRNLVALNGKDVTILSKTFHFQKCESFCDVA